MKFPRIAEDRSQLEQFAEAVEAGDFGGKVELAGNSLVIPEQERPPLPEPVITIDGVVYFHKHEFDVDELLTASVGTDFDLLSGETKEAYSYPGLIVNTPGPGGAPRVLFLSLDNAIAFGVTGSDYYAKNYTSRAFTVVDTQEEVTDNTKICLPTCSAYYGFLSEDGKTFISYYNLKAEEVPEYVDSIKQGNAVIPLKDVRLPDATAADVGKVLGVDEEGELVLQPAPGGYEPAIVQISNIYSPLTSEQIAILTSSELAILHEGNASYIKGLDAPAYSGNNMGFYYISGSVATYLQVNKSTGAITQNQYTVVPRPYGLASGTYILKYTSDTATMEWVKETA